MRRKRGFKPAYWWDYSQGPGGLVIIVETNDTRVKNPVCRLSRNSYEEAERIVQNLKAGRALSHCTETAQQQPHGTETNVNESATDGA